MRRLATLLVLPAAVVVAACGASRGASSSAPAAKRDGVTELRSIGQLRAAFNAHPGIPRLIVLASPT
jgi:ABC-type glycerol-3-phosphate transport system substrate-binding protein